MNKKSMIIPILALGIAAIVLAGANGALSKTAATNALEEKNEMMLTLLPGSTGFTPEEFDTTEHETINYVYKAENGFVIESTAYGYNGEVTVMVGVDKEGSVTGLVVRDLCETPGLGAEALTDTAFLSQFLGTKGEAEVGANVDALTGATVSSKAVTKAVNSAIAYVTGADTSSSATEWGG